MTAGPSVSYAFLIVFVLFTGISLVDGRLTEFTTERVPVLAHNLHSANIDLKVLSKRALLGTRSGFRFKTGEFHQTAKGGQRVRLVQTYANYEVYGPTAVAELDMNGYFTGHLYGEVARNLNKDIPNPEACVRDVQMLLNRAIRLERLNPADENIEERDGRRVIYANPVERKAKIVYVVEFFYHGHNFVSYPVYYMDACSNAVMFSYNKIRNMTIPNNQDGYKQTENRNPQNIVRDPSSTLKFNRERERVKAGVACTPSAEGNGGNPNTGMVQFNVQPLCLPVKKDGLVCTMEGTYVKVVNNDNTEDMTRSTPVSFNCANGYDDAINGAFGVANDAFYFGELSGKFFEDLFGQRALSFVPRMVVHYGSKYENAFWTGKDMYFGDGQYYFYPLVALDVVSHELAHGVTDRYSDLVYMGQSGGINEAFSDITAAATEFYVTGGASWTIGATIVKSGTAFRFMNDPPKDGKSIKNAWFYRPFMNVHFSSGVFNYAFYQMVEHQGVPMYVAYAQFLKANQELWGKFTGFRRGACNVAQASYDTGSDYAAVKGAFRKTWLFLPFCNVQALKTTLFPGEIRPNVLVSTHRSPILEIDMTTWPGTGVHVMADDLSVIRVVAATDDDAENVIAKGNNYVAFPANHSRLYVKLMTDQEKDVKVTLNVLNVNIEVK